MRRERTTAWESVVGAVGIENAGPVSSIAATVQRFLAEANDHRGFTRVRESTRVHRRHLDPTHVLEKSWRRPEVSAEPR